MDRYADVSVIMQPAAVRVKDKHKGGNVWTKVWSSLREILEKYVMCRLRGMQCTSYLFQKEVQKKNKKC
jgi:hypothetical protein